MSWNCLRALVAAFLEANYSGTEQSRLLNTTPMPDQLYWPDKPTEHSRISRFGMTCELLEESLGAELLTWYLAGFRAKTYPSPEKAQDLTENDQDCGEKWRGWSARLCPNGSGWKTAQHSLLEDSDESYLTFPRSGMTRGGLLWELPMLELPTSGTGYGYWPTPVASDTSSRNKPYAQGGTPRSWAVKWCPTPTAHNAKETNAPSESGRNTPKLAAQAGGPLNPEWVEKLMGWPKGWTNIQT